MKTSAKKRAYQAEYQKQPDEVAKRVARNRARRHAEAQGLVHKGDGKELDHKVPLGKGGSTSDKNTRVVDASTNRAWRANHPSMYGKKK